MRAVLRGVQGRPEHIGLGYGSWAPVAAGPGVPPDKRGKVPDNDRPDWLSGLANKSVWADYQHAFARWKTSFLPPDYLSEFELAGRLLVGHGNASPTEVGLTVHHTWGVPMIPGSALKGLLAHYVETKYGPVNSLQGDDGARAEWQGVTWDKNRIARGPGGYYRALFGAPDAEQDGEMRGHHLEAGAARGWVVFHDALYVPGSVIDPKSEPKIETPFAVDVLTVHHKRYYDSAGSQSACDYDDPNPVAFLSVRPRARFLLALSGPRDWTELAGALLSDALAEWGVGGKTSAGYGQGNTLGWKEAASPPSTVLNEFLQALRNPPTVDGERRPTARELLSMVQAAWFERLARLRPADREAAVNAIRREITSQAVRQQRDELIGRLLQA